MRRRRGERRSQERRFKQKAIGMTCERVVRRGEEGGVIEYVGRIQIIHRVARKAS